MSLEILKRTFGYLIKEWNMKIRKTPQGYEAIGDIDAQTVDGKHASDLKHGIASDDETAIKVNIGSFICPGSIGNYSVTNVGFKPRFVEFMGGFASGLVAQCNLGWMNYNGNQRAITSSVYSANHLSAGDESINYCFLVRCYDSTYLVTGEFVSMDADGFTINFSIVNTAFRIMWKAIR